MEGQAFINEKDIWKTWGATLLRGAYEELLKPCAMKEYIENSSRIEDGKHYTATPELSKVKERNVVIPILIEGNSVDDYLVRYESFLAEISKGIFTMKIPRLKRVYKLVYTDCSKYGNYGETKGKFTLKLVEPNPKDRIKL